MIQQKIINNALVWYDDRYFHRWLDAVGVDVKKFILNTGSPVDDTTGDPTQFVMTVVEAGAGDTTCVNAQSAGDKLLITTAANEYDGINLQLAGESFKLTAGKPLYFGCKAKVSDATQSDILIGLCELDTTLMATSSAHAVAVSGDGIFFAKLDAVTTITAKNYLDGTQNATANYGTALSTDYVWYEMYYDGDSVYFYVDNVLVTCVSGSLADGDLTPSINFRAGAAAAKTMTIAELKVIQLT